MRSLLAVAVAVSIGCVLVAAPRPAAAGAFAQCAPPPTVESEVAHAKLVVIAKATARTKHRGHGDLRTTLEVIRVLRGDEKARTITVDDCSTWKCTFLDLAKGQTVVLLLDAGEHRGHYEPLGPHCQNGFQRSGIAYEPDEPIVKAVIAAAAPPAPSP
jgi:hypothetical protein